MTENPSTSYGKYDLLGERGQQGISFAGEGVKTNTPRPGTSFNKRASEKTATPGAYGEQNIFAQLLINILMLLTGALDPDNKGNDKLIGLISKAFGIEDDANHTGFRDLQSDIKTRGKDAVRDGMDYSNFDGKAALAAAKLGQPVLGKNVYDSQMLELIGQHESGGDYNRVYGKAKRIDLTNMTINEVMAWQKAYTDNGSASSAAGKYQVIRKTLTGAVKEMGLSGNEKFDEAMQDKIGMHLLDKRGYSKYLNGDMKQSTFVNNVAHEWASFKTTAGRGAYDGDGLNHAKVSAGTTLATAERDKTMLKSSFADARDNVKPAPQEPDAPAKPLVLAATTAQEAVTPPYRPLVLAPTPG